MSHRIQILETQQAFFVERGETLLQAALKAGIALPHDCQLGGCGTCRLKLVEGQVCYDEQPMGLAPDEAAAGYALACQAQPLGDLLVSTAREDEACAEPMRHRAQVEAVRPLTPTVLQVRLQVPDLDAALDYRPGQYLKLFTQDGHARSFSMASVPRGGSIELHVRRIPGGAVTDRILPGMAAGDAVEVELPHGTFFHRARDYRPLLMVATGTGIAPIKAILESLMDDPDCPPVSLYWGMREEGDLYLHEQILGWVERLYDFRYVPVLSRGGVGWQGRRGYVHHAAVDDLGDLSEHAIYLCGSPDMIRDARQAFLDRGASTEHIYADSFTFQWD